MKNSNGAGKNTNYIIGIDEVGRGPIAGPVAVCAFICARQDLAEMIKGIDLPIRDSKKLTKIQREKWFKYLNELKREGKCNFEVSYVSAEMIDKFGINKCIQKALDKSLGEVAKQSVQNLSRVGAPVERVKREDFVYSVKPDCFKIFLDGGLKAPVEYTNQETVIKGDELYPVISFASIIAKVSRDKIMTKYAEEYPNYGFENHSGYGTKLHYEAIKKHGITPLHRKTFLKGII